MSYDCAIEGYLVTFDTEQHYLNCRMEYLEYVDCAMECLDSCNNSIVNGEPVSFLEFIQTEAYDHSKCCVKHISQYSSHSVISDNISIDTSTNAGFNFVMSSPNYISNNYISNGTHMYYVSYDGASDFDLSSFSMPPGIIEPLGNNIKIKEEKKKVIDDSIENRFDILDL